MARFLNEQVVGRTCKSRKRKHEDDAIVDGIEIEIDEEVSASNDNSNIKTEKTIGYKTVDGYVCAITKLWSEQQHMMNGNDPNPRGHISVREVIKTCKLKTAALKKSHLNDRVEGEYFSITTNEQIMRFPSSIKIQYNA